MCQDDKMSKVAKILLSYKCIDMIVHKFVYIVQSEGEKQVGMIEIMWQESFTTYPN